MNRILDGADNALYLPVAFTVASRRFLMDESEHLAQSCEAPLEL